MKPRSSYTGHTTGVFPKWSDTTWVPAPEVKPTIPLVRGQYQAFTDGFCASLVLEQTAGTSALRTEGATHTDPSTLGSFKSEHNVQGFRLSILHWGKSPQVSFRNELREPMHSTPATTVLDFS